MASDPAEENRKLVPIAQFVTSSSPHGATAVMDVFIEPSKLDEYVKMVTPATREIRKFAENLFCEISVDPTDQGHIRVLHGWTRDSAWIRENVESQPWFGEYIKALYEIRDPNRSRVIQQYDRIPID